MKKNIYDYILGELVYRVAVNTAANGPYLDIISNLPFNDQAPFTLNTMVIFTSVVRNIPTGYTVKANTHIITYPIIVPADINSSAALIGSAVPIIFATAGDLFTINDTITLEKLGDPDIVLVKTFTVTAIGAIYYGLKSLNNDFTLPGLSSTVYIEQNQRVLLPSGSSQYIYFVFPNGSNLPLFFRDRNGLVIDISNFTITTLGSDVYLVLSWITTVPAYSNWEIVYTL